MKIGIAGPISTESIEDLIDDDITKLPKGTQGAPFLGTLIKSLIKKGHQVSAYTLDDTLPPEQLNPITATGQYFKIYYSPCRKHSVRMNGRFLGRSLDFFYREIKALKIAINIDQPDIVHGHWSYEFGLAAIYSNRPYVVTCHDSPLKVLKYMFNYYRFGRLLMALLVFYKAEHLTAVSAYLKSEIEKFTKADISVIPNPTPVETIKNPFDNLKIELALTVPKIVMLLNGWGPLKNAKPAMQAFNILLNNKPKATLHIFGHDFQMGGPAQQWAKKNNIDQNIVFHGPTAHSEILVFLNQATFLFHPALEESLSMSSIEAMSMGIPVIGGEKSGGLPWVLDYGKAGLLTDVTKPKDMADKMNALLENQPLYLNLREQGLERVRQLFSQEAVAKAYERIYQIILTSDH
jgi:L-malate glycosyltransferase